MSVSFAVVHHFALCWYIFLLNKFELELGCLLHVYNYEINPTFCGNVALRVHCGSCVDEHQHKIVVLLMLWRHTMKQDSQYLRHLSHLARYFQQLKQQQQGCHSQLCAVRYKTIAQCI